MIEALSAKEAISQMWSIFPTAQDGAISLRAISPKGAPTLLPTLNQTFNATEFPDIADRQRAFEAEALRLSDEGYNVYIVMNPIVSNFTGDRSNGRAVRDKDIASRRCLLIDMDRTGALVAPATSEEIADASAVADKISEHLHRKYEVTPVRVMSGNGMHLYLPLKDIPNDPTSKQCCRSLLLAMANLFNTETIKIDTTVANASRITKVPGTVARKGTPTEDRPFRMAYVL